MKRLAKDSSTERITSISRASFRRLAMGLQLNVGAEVLHVGNGDNNLSERFREFGVQVIGWNGLLKLSGEPNNNWPPRPGPRLSDKFSAVVVEPQMLAQENLFDHQMFATTAQLLSYLRPNGRLAFLLSASENGTGQKTHSVTCYTRHLSFFPGVCRVLQLAHSPFTSGSLLWRSSRYSSPWWRLVFLKIPTAPIAATTWNRLAEEAALHCHGQTCHICSVSAELAQKKAA